MKKKGIVLIDKTDRKKLCEGRNSQMGFAFLKKLSDDEYEAVQPISPCKDYLNDVVWAEHNDKPIGVYGLSYKKVGIFNDDYNYIAIQLLKTTGGTYHNGTNGGTLEKDQENLHTNIDSLEKVIHYVEEKLGCPNRTKIDRFTSNTDQYLVAVPMFWCHSTNMISLYSLLLRMAQFMKKDEKPEEFLKTFKHPLDLGLWNAAKLRYARMLSDGVDKIAMPAKEIASWTSHQVHNYGICGLILK